ncbi:MAG: ParA family protein [Clostridiales bacterium]|nr:ParA family protein [Clostridiales bacterium]
MILPNTPYTILVGNYGSGKTELSLALALEMRRREPDSRIALVDLDIVNPYFRSAEQSDLLQQHNIEVFMPSFAMSTVDIPALPANIMAVFEQPFDRVIIDVGGDDTGATALGRYAPQLTARREEITMLYVVNPFRPLSGTEEDIAELFGLIGQKARITPDALVNNANLQEHTTAQDVMEGQALLEKVSQRLNLPIAFTAGLPQLKEQLPDSLQENYFAFTPIMKPDWLVDIDE